MRPQSPSFMSSPLEPPRLTLVPRADPDLPPARTGPVAVGRLAVLEHDAVEAAADDRRRQILGRVYERAIARSARRSLPVDPDQVHTRASAAQYGERLGIRCVSNVRRYPRMRLDAPGGYVGLPLQAMLKTLAVVGAGEPGDFVTANRDGDGRAARVLIVAEHGLVDVQSRPNPTDDSGEVADVRLYPWRDVSLRP